MAKFRVLETRRCAEACQAEFVVLWLDGSVSAGQTFTVFDTHHPIEVRVISSTARPGGAVLRCEIELGWEGNYAPSLIDTDGSTRSERFRYVAGAVCPDFDDAVQVFRTFLQGQGWPTTIVWARAGNIIRGPSESITVHRRHSDGEFNARSSFDEGRRAGLGVALEAVCTLGDTTVATVEHPTDAREAELHMYPSNGGLKMSVATPRVEGTIRWSSC